LEEKGEIQTYTFYESTNVEVLPMTEEEIAYYVGLNTCMDKAGAYGIQNEFACYVKGIQGDYNSVVGLPVGRIYQELKQLSLLKF
jgi:septum formation protein